MMREPGSGEPVRSGQRDPQLRAVEHSRRRAEYSEWAMPEPAVMRSSRPGRTSTRVPVVPRCPASPVTSQEAVCSPVRGWPGTAIPPVRDTSPGP